MSSVGERKENFLNGLNLGRESSLEPVFWVPACRREGTWEHELVVAPPGAGGTWEHTALILALKSSEHCLKN